MKHVYQTISWLALGATIVPSLLYFSGSLGLGPVKVWMLVATAAWFATVPLWMGRKT
jgi:hypothetical protein